MGGKVELRTSPPRRLPGVDVDRLRSLGLSRRELAVLELVARGSTNAEAARALGISPLTVKKHLERMYAATGARNRAALIALLSGGSATRRDRPAARVHDLPAPLTSFVGREREIDEVRSLLVTSRLVTLGGPGGIGKTRLAIEVAARVTDRCADGVWFVELDDVSDPRVVLQTVSTALGVRESGRTRLGALIEELRAKQLLVVVDDCEHVASACAAVIEPLLRSCAEVRVLATSREALGVPGEAFWQVPALSLPEPLKAHGPAVRAAAERSEAVRLFVERASLRRAGFTLTADNAVAIGHVCRRLDGMPLAIELAAARLSVLSVDELAARLDRRSGELADPAGATPRHRTLRAVVDWSYQLLAVAEARLFERMTVFSGGCTLAAVESVCPGGDVAAPDLIDLIGRLVDKSFVIADTRPSETRYRTLETLQRYGRERLERTDELDALTRRHAAYFCALAEAAEPELKGARQLAWYDQLEVEHDNLRAALRWSLERDPELALRLAGALWRFWDVRMYKEEGRRWLDAALEHEDEASPAVRVKALNGAGNMAQATGEYARAAALHQRSLALARDLGDTASIGRSLSNVGDQALNVGDHERARGLHREALALFESTGDPWGIAITCIELGQVAYDLGELEAAKGHYSRGLAMAREAGDDHRTAHALLHVGKVARERGDLAAASRLLTDALRTVVRYADGWMTTIAIGQLACLATARGDARAGARLFAAVDAARQALGVSQAPHWSRDLDRWLAVARSGLDERAFAASWEAGTAMTLDDAIAGALRLAEATPGGALAAARGRE